jgi:tetrahydromethanopterin S-methyltransferase subunit G
MKNKFAYAFVMFSIVVLLSSCSKVPQVELDAAKAAIEDARTNGADLYVPAEFAALQDSLNAVNELIEARKGKMFANFGEVKTKLAQITELSAAVKTNAETRKAEVQAEVDAVMAEVNTLIAEAKNLVANAPKGKEGKAAVDAISAEITTVEAAAAEATALVEQGKWIEALDKLNAAKEKVSAVNTELQTVIEKFKGKR